MGADMPRKKNPGYAEQALRGHRRSSADVDANETANRAPTKPGVNRNSVDGPNTSFQGTNYGHERVKTGGKS